MGLDFFKLEELTPSSSSAFSSSSTESDMSYGQSLLHPSEWIITKETPKVDGENHLWHQKSYCSAHPLIILADITQQLKGIHVF